MLKIKKGNPVNVPSSYTRFVLPFAYKPEKTTMREKERFCYRCTDIPERVWRERYLTDETAKILFKRAKWLTLHGEGASYDVEMTFTNGKTRIVTVLPPSIVLFEWSPNEEPKADVLKTGFLIQELCFSDSNNEEPDLDEFLELNELFKYWQRPFEGHEDKGYKKVLSKLPWKLGEKDGIGTWGYGPSESYFERWASLLEVPLIDDNGTAWLLFPPEWGETARKRIAGAEIEGQNWLVYADNRTYVWTCAIIEEGADALKKYFGRLEHSVGNFAHWIKLLNVDLPSYSRNEFTDFDGRAFEKGWAEERTYKRWEECGTCYGFSYHSGAMLGPATGPPMWKHFGMMYFDMVLLLLYLRVTLFRFSKELSEISAAARDTKKGGMAKWTLNFRELRWAFTLFTNLYQFPLISNQQQAVEMYALARKSMDVDELFREIQDEIRSSHDFVSIEEAQDQTNNTTRLTVVATMGLIAALNIGFWGMSKFLDEFEGLPFINRRSNFSKFSVTLFFFALLLGVVIRFSDRLAGVIDRLASPKKNQKG